MIALANSDLPAVRLTNFCSLWPMDKTSQHVQPRHALLSPTVHIFEIKHTFVLTFLFFSFFLLIHPKTCFNLMAPYHDAAITDTNYLQELIKNYLWVHQWIFPSDISSCCCHTSKLSTRTMKWFSGNLPGPSINVVMQFTDAMTKTC